MAAPLSYSSVSRSPLFPIRPSSSPRSRGLHSTSSNLEREKKSIDFPISPSSTIVGVAIATSVLLAPSAALSAALDEPSNALSLPTWAIHVSSVVEWVTAMILVWEYGEKTGFESWKGLSWGMVPLLGGALCACTWHFFYNAESLEVLVALQAALTVIGNMTMCFAAFRIFRASQGGSKSS